MDRADRTPDDMAEDFLFHIYRGSELLSDNRVAEAQVEIERALALQPSDVEGQGMLAAVYFRLGLFTRAIQIYESILNAHPEENSVRVNLAMCLLKTEAFEAAAVQLEKVVKALPEHARAWGYLGLAYERIGKLEQAEEALRRSGHGKMAERVLEKRRSSSPPRDESSRMTVEPFAPTPMRVDMPLGLNLPMGLHLQPAINIPSGLNFPGGLNLSGSMEAAGLTAPPVPRAAELRIESMGTGGGAQKHALSLVELSEHSRVATTSTTMTSESAELLSLYLTKNGAPRPLAVRVDSMRAQVGATRLELIERGGRAAHGLMGGISAIARVNGDGQLLVAPRHAHRFVQVILDGDPLFVREEAIVAFDLALEFESGRIPMGEREPLQILQLRGVGEVVLESLGELVSVPVMDGRSVTVRPASLVGWCGRLVPHAAEGSLLHGLVTLSGDGTVFMAGR